MSFKDSSGHLVKTSETAFDPYGVELNGIGQQNSFQNRWELQGHEKESTFGLNRVTFGARTYNPTIGRFDRVDPLADARNWLTPYNFVQNNPVNRIDPDGAFDTKADAKQYAEDNNIRTGLFSRNKIQEGSDGVWAINNKKEHTSNSEFGVMTGALVTEVWKPDATIYKAGLDFALLGGFGFGIQVADINYGDDAGYHIYGYFNGNIGFGGGAGVGEMNVDFNEQNEDGLTLTADVFSGTDNSYSGGIGVATAGYTYGRVDGKADLNPNVPKRKLLYSGVSPGLGEGPMVGGMYSATVTSKPWTIWRKK